jgi:PHD/YefM family antitoxin component YafN of YafNO toxin-antitoxin module
MVLVMKEYEDPVLFGPSQLVNSSTLGRNVGSYLDMTTKRPVFIQRGSDVEAVLINIDEYRALLIEEQKVEELYESVLALRRLLEAIEAKAPLKDIESVMQKYGITEQMLEEGLGDVED